MGSHRRYLVVRDPSHVNYVTGFIQGDIAECPSAWASGCDGGGSRRRVIRKDDESEPGVDAIWCVRVVDARGPRKVDTLANRRLENVLRLLDRLLPCAVRPVAASGEAKGEYGGRSYAAHQSAGAQHSDDDPTTKIPRVGARSHRAEESSGRVEARGAEFEVTRAKNPVSN